MCCVDLWCSKTTAVNVLCLFPVAQSYPLLAVVSFLLQHKFIPVITDSVMHYTPRVLVVSRKLTSLSLSMKPITIGDRTIFSQKRDVCTLLYIDVEHVFQFYCLDTWNDGDKSDVKLCLTSAALWISCPLCMMSAALCLTSAVLYVWCQLDLCLSSAALSDFSSTDCLASDALCPTSA